MSWKVLAAKGKPKKARVPRDIRIYAIGDVHGRADLLAALFERIDKSIKDHPIKHAMHIFLGDYVDRGPQSREVIDAVIDRKLRHAVLCLKGNHESFVAQFLTDPTVLPDWEQMGGVNTLLSYGVKPSTRDDPKDARDVAQAFRAALPVTHRKFLEGLAVSFTCGDYFFAHAGVRPGIPFAKQSENDLLWIREDFLLHEEDFGKIVVHGHTPTAQPDIRPNRINIDTGAYATGKLTCLVLQGDGMTIL